MISCMPAVWINTVRVISNQHNVQVFIHANMQRKYQIMHHTVRQTMQWMTSFIVGYNDKRQGRGSTRVVPPLHVSITVSPVENTTHVQINKYTITRICYCWQLSPRFNHILILYLRQNHTVRDFFVLHCVVHLSASPSRMVFLWTNLTSAVKKPWNKTNCTCNQATSYGDHFTTRTWTGNKPSVEQTSTTDHP